MTHMKSAEISSVLLVLLLVLDVLLPIVDSCLLQSCPTTAPGNVSRC